MCYFLQNKVRLFVQVSITVYTVNSLPIHLLNHRRRIDFEDKAKVVTSDWGTEYLPLKLFCLGPFETNG